MSVTEFGKLNAEYKKAYDAVVSKKSNEDDSFNEEAFGMNAFDISIVDAEGNKVEPKDTVDISLKIKELPKEAIDSFNLVALEIQHLDESQNELKVETVASLEDGSIQINDKSAVAEFKLDSFSTFTLNWSNNQNHTTVHYGYMNGNTFVEFGEDQKPDPTDPSGGWAYLLYDFEGKDSENRDFDYNYVGTYYHTSTATNPATGGTAIAPVMRRIDNSNAWRYYATSNGYEQDALTNQNNWPQAANNSHVYVVYKEPEIDEGGSPTIEDDTPTPDEPTILKQSVENGDDTNTLSLSITSSSNEMEVETLADVIIVLDLFSSMSKDLHGNSVTGDYRTNPQSRYYQAKEAVKLLAEDLYGQNEDSRKALYRLGLVTFAGNAQVRQPLTADENIFLNSVDAINGYDGKGTNWEHSIKLGNEMKVDEHRATFVIFVTDGEPTASQTRWGSELTNQQLPDYNMFLAGGANGGNPGTWSDGLGHNYSGLHFYLRTGTFGTTDANNQTTGAANVRRSGEASYDDIQSVLDHKKNMYVIAISKDIADDTKQTFKDLQRLVTSDHVKTATEAGAIEQAFEDIKSEIIGTLGWADIKMTDGITDLTNTVAKTGLVDFDRES